MTSIEGWTPKKLTELADYINGFAFKPHDWGKDGLPIIRIEQLKDPEAVTDYFDGKLPPAVIIEDGDLIFSWSASLFLKIWRHGRAALNQHLFKVIERDNVERVFLKSFIEFHLPSLTAASHGSTMQHITRKELQRFCAPCPDSKLEQSKIAEIVSTVDRAIEQTEAMVAKHERTKAGLMQDLLTRGIDKQGTLRSEHTHGFKNSPLGRIPDEWEVRRLGSLLNDINQGWSPDCEPNPADVGQWGVLKTTAVVWQGYQDHENKALPASLTPRANLEIKAGDLLMTRAGPNSRVGVVAYVYATRSKLMLSDKLYRLIPAKNADARFLGYALSGFQSQRHLAKLKTGMAESQTNISQEIVKTMLTVCPDKKEQVQIADCIDRFSKASIESITALDKLRSLKLALMQDLLRGRKRVTALLEPKPQREKICAVG